MRILVHDYSGHPFQAELSRELSARGHAVTHSYCAAYQSGKGALEAASGETVVFDPIARGEVIHKLHFARRLLQELRYGVQLAAQTRRVKPDVVLAANTPIPTLLVFAAYCLVRRIPWVLWHQDVQAVAIRSFAGKQLSKGFLAVAKAIELGERWGARRASGIVVITDAFVDVHRRWGTADKVVVIPNWAPLDEIYPVPRENEWAREQDLLGVPTLVYSGTLGLKHDPALMVGLASRVRALGQPVRLVVVNQGPAAQVVRDEAARLGVPLTLLPFQPYERLPEVLGSGDVLVVLLEQTAGAFSVPSKTLSYLCAGRPILGLMPGENLASELVTTAGSTVLEPVESSLDEAAAWVAGVLADPAYAAELGRRARELAEREFALKGAADKFEELLKGCTR